MELTEHRRNYFESLNNSRAFTKAANLGLEVYHPDEYTLTLDIDSPALPTQYHLLLDVLKEFYVVDREVIKPSKSGNLHVYLHMKTPFTPTEKLVLQAVLGSDPKRELLGLVRAKEGIGEASLMFEMPVDLEAQRRSFAYGNVALGNPQVTREMVDVAAENLEAERAGVRVHLPGLREDHQELPDATILQLLEMEDQVAERETEHLLSVREQ